MLVLGGGIIGLSIAWQCARAGVEVTVLCDDEGHPPVSRCAAGMLAPNAEAQPAHVELSRLGRQSLSAYPSFLSALEEDSGKCVPLCSEGTLVVAEDADGLRWLTKRVEQMGKHGRKLTALQVRKLEPLLSPSVLGALYFPEERSVNVAKLLTALKVASTKRGVRFLRGRVLEVQKGKEGWEVMTSSGKVEYTPKLVIAPGCYLGSMRFPEHLFVPQVIPNHGTLVEVTMQGCVSLRFMVRTRHVYLCPTEDGLCRLGASSHYEGEEQTALVGDVRTILRYGWQVVPQLDYAQWGNVYHGQRPVCRTGTPILDVASDTGLYWAVGWGRSGVLLAPWAAQHFMAQLNRERTGG